MYYLERVLLIRLLDVLTRYTPFSIILAFLPSYHQYPLCYYVETHHADHALLRI